jgi:hypothetical protein
MRAHRAGIEHGDVQDDQEHERRQRRGDERLPCSSSRRGGENGSAL